LHWTSWLFPLMAALLSLCLIPFSERIAHLSPVFFDKYPMLWLFDTAKQFAATTTIISVCIVIWTLTPRRRVTILVFLIAFIFTTVVCQTLKLLAGRARPFNAVLMDYEAKNRLWVDNYVKEHPEVGLRAEPHDQWLGFSLARPENKNNFDSFPSGHTYSAFLLAAFLTALYPRLAWLWLLWAVSCAVARVAGRMHYLEDVLMGGALGWFLPNWIFSWRWPIRVSEMVLRKIEKK
jgi:membrane-associated phospholipid phosphatase